MSRVSTAIGLCVLGGAAVFTIGAMVRAAGDAFEWSWFYPWALAPYVVFGIMCVKLRLADASVRRAALIAAVLVSFVSLRAYANAIFLDVSSTSALAFVFMPLYLLVGGFMVFGIAAFLGRWLQSSNDT